MDERMAPEFLFLKKNTFATNFLIMNTGDVKDYFR